MIYKWRYNLYSILQVSVGGINLLLLYRIFGTSEQSQVFLLGFSVLLSMQFIGLSCNEQFIYKYIDIKCKSEHFSQIFYSTYVYVSLMLGIVFYLLVLIFNKPVYNLFISGLNVQTYNLFNKYFNILSLSIIFIIPNNVIQAYLNANSKIGLAYLSQSIPNIFILIGFISFLYFESNIINLAYLFLIGNTIVFIFLFMFKKNINKFSLDRNILETIKSSLKIRTAHNIHNFLSLIIINNFVSGLPLPESSTFLYTKKVSDTIFGVIYNPSNRLLVNLISSYKLENNLFKIKPVLIKNTIIMSIVFLFIGAGGFILIPGLNYIYPLNTSIIEWIGITFSCLMIVNLLMAVEIPYAIINLAFNASRIFFISNSIYILFLYIFVRYCNFYFGHYTLAFGLATVQIVNFILIRQFAILSYIK